MMKKLFCFLLMSLFFINCNSEEEIKTISTKELRVVLTKDKIQLLDVRTPKEIAQGSIQSALFVNYFDVDFKSKATKKLNSMQPVYVLCRSGNRSDKVAKILKENGYDVYNVLGGYNQWKKENQK